MNTNELIKKYDNSLIPIEKEFYKHCINYSKKHDNIDEVLNNFFDSPYEFGIQLFKEANGRKIITVEPDSKIIWEQKEFKFIE